jgi:hypothetical protein
MDQDPLPGLIKVSPVLDTEREGLQKRKKAAEAALSE